MLVNVLYWYVFYCLFHGKDISKYMLEEQVSEYIYQDLNE